MFKFFCKLNIHKKAEIAYGYPAYSKTYLIIYRCQRCGMKMRVWDDLFAEPRPKHFPFHEDYMISIESEAQVK